MDIFAVQSAMVQTLSWHHAHVLFCLVDISYSDTNYLAANFKKNKKP